MAMRDWHAERREGRKEDWGEGVSARGTEASQPELQNGDCPLEEPAGQSPLGAHPSIVLSNWLELPEESGSSLQFNAAFHPEVFAAKVRQLTALLVADAPLE